MKLIKETPYCKVWKAVNGDVFGFNGQFFKYLVVDTRNGGETALRTNSVLQAMAWEPKFTPEEIMSRFLLLLIEEFSLKNTDFNRKRIIEVEVSNWNVYAKSFNRPEFLITEKFHFRQDLANRFAEIYEAL